MYSENDTLAGGFPHSDIFGSKLVCQLPEAFRRLPRPSSPVIAKASTTCTYSLDPIALNPWLNTHQSHCYPILRMLDYISKQTRCLRYNLNPLPVVTTWRNNSPNINDKPITSSTLLKNAYRILFPETRRQWYALTSIF
jgi:hypothetical protein